MQETKRISKLLMLYRAWITSLLLGYYAYVQPLNTLLSKIRQAGVISISAGSVKENLSIVIHAVLPSVVLWGALFILWLICMIAGSLIIRKKAKNWKNIWNIIENQKLLDTLFYIAACIEMIWAAFYYATFHMPFATILVFISMQCFTARIVLTEHSRKEWIWIMCLVALGIACEFYTTRGFVLRAILLIFASKGVDAKYIMKWFLLINAVAFGLIVLISFLGISGVWIEHDAYRSIEDAKDRYVLGYNSPNTTHYIVIRMALIAFYIWWDKLRLWHIVVTFAANYVMYLITDSRTGFLVGFVACVLALFFRYFKKIRDWKLWSYLAIAMIFALVIFSLHFLQWNFHIYDNLHECPAYVYKVNDLMVGRIHQALKFTQDIELSPFGTRQSGVYCDMGYIKFFLQEGFLIYAVYLAAVMKLLLWQNKTKDYAGYIIVVAISLRMLMESSFVPFVFQNMILMLFIGNWHNLLPDRAKREENE